MDRMNAHPLFQAYAPGSMSHYRDAAAARASLAAIALKDQDMPAWASLHSTESEIRGQVATMITGIAPEILALGSLEHSYGLGHPVVREARRPVELVLGQAVELLVYAGEHREDAAVMVEALAETVLALFRADGEDMAFRA